MIVTGGVPVGSVCTLVETPPVAPDANHTWLSAQITPVSVTITNADTGVGFTVTNTVAAVLPTAVDATVPMPESHPSATTPGGNSTTGENGTEADLAGTGPSSDLVWLVWIGLVGVLGGLALSWPARRARRRDA